MNTVYALLALLVLGVCSAEIIGSSCRDQSKLLCALRKSDCDIQEEIRRLCPKTCGTCGDPTASAKVYNLTYFNAKSRGEQIRWILEQADATWINTTIELKDWETIKPTTLTGQLPFLEVDGVTIAQSGAIAMYLGREFNLAGRNSLDMAKVEMIWDTTQDTFNAFATFRYLPSTPTQKAEAEKKYYNQTLPKFIKFLENQLDGDEWLVGNYLTLADIVVACLFDLQINDKALNESKPISKLVQRVYDLPRIKAWIASRPDNPY